MLLTSQIRFVVFIVTMSHVADNSISYSPDSEIRCNWNCSVHNADLATLTREMKTSMTTNKLIKLGVRYEKTVDDKCANETSFYSSEYASEYCQVCLVNKRLFHSTTAIKRLINDAFPEIEQREIRAICSLNPARTTVSSPMNYSSRSSTICHLITFKAEFDRIGYQAVEKYDLRSCINVTISNGTNSPKGALEQRAWPSRVLICFSTVYIVVFMHYSLAFLCLFFPTEILQDGVSYINLDGASPVSLRSLAGNYFFSRSDGVWHKPKTFFLRVFIIPLPFLLSSVFLEYKTNVFFKLPSPVRGLFIEFCFSYCIRAFYTSFHLKRPMKAKPCFVCKLVKPTILSCQDELPQLIKNHLRLQPLIFIECWKLFKRCLVNYVTTSASVISFGGGAIRSLLRLALFIILFLCIPVVITVLVIVVCLLTLIGILLTSPVAALCLAQYTPINTKSEIRILFIKIVDGTLSYVSMTGAVILLLSAAFGTLFALRNVFELSFSEEHLPYVTCFVFVLYYIWSNYSHFTKTYHELALALFYYKKSLRQNQVKYVPHNSNQLQNLPSTADNDLENIMAIPKRLFDMACEELMPLREGVCILILKIILIVSSVLIVFSLTILSTSETTPLMKTLLTFLTLSFPKIVAIYVDGGWQEDLRAKVVEEKVPIIVEKFLSETSETNRGQRGRNVKTDEVIFSK